jgi:hypothetical protein
MDYHTDLCGDAVGCHSAFEEIAFHNRNTPPNRVASYLFAPDRKAGLESSSEISLASKLSRLSEFDRQPGFEALFCASEGLYLWMKEALQAGATCATSCTVVSVEVFLAESIFSAFENQ